MKEETKRLIDEVQGIIDDAAAEKKDRNTEPDEIEIRQAAENFRDVMTRNGVDYFLSGKYQPKGDPKPKALISLHGPSEGILRAMGGALYLIATDTKASPVSRLIFVMKTDIKQFVGNLADNYDRRRSMLENMSVDFYNLAQGEEDTGSNLLFQQARYYQGVADGFRYARWILETLVSAQDEDE